MPENLLTDTKIRSAKSTDRDWKLSDGGGLFLLVKPTGGKPRRWKYRLQGKENLFAIGGFPQVSLAEARAAREKARALVTQGTGRSPGANPAVFDFGDRGSLPRREPGHGAIGAAGDEI